jgi:hypothetical protein
VVNPPSVVPSSYNSNACQYQYAYTPSFLTSTTIYNFNYPIFQAMGCVGNKLELRCPTSQLIHIYAAYYGLQPSTNTNYCGTNADGGPVLCYRPDSYNYLVATCENKTVCSVSVNSALFGDPCSGYANKQYLIQYQCVDKSALISQVDACPINSTTMSICPALSDPVNQQAQLWCDPTIMSIVCDSGKVISILCAWFGIDPNIQCPGFSAGVPIWYSLASYELVYDTCNGQNSCMFDGEF